MNGKNIVKYRNDNCISQKELAERIGIAKSTLSRWENGKSEPREDEYKRLLEVVGEEYLCDGKEVYKKSAKDSLGEVSERINDILYEVSKIESKQASFESQKLKSDLFHKRLRTTVIIITCILILLLAIGTWIWLMNYGFGGDIVSCTAELNETSIIDDTYNT